ncbi:MAG: RNA 3'-terminal phosphate cyclase [Kofleriaceae bacterium]
MREGVDIDGSRGEGGGQILRTSLALSIITGRPLIMRNIRAGRAKPGLRRQHLTCVHAAAQLCNAKLRGADVGSQHLEFEPTQPTTSTSLELDIGTAGSTTLVVQTILVPAIVAGRELRVGVVGGTHNPMAPPFDFIERVFLPHLQAMGAGVSLALERYGFATGGGGGNRDFYDAPAPDRGRLVVTITPGTLKPIAVVETPEITSRHACAILARLPTHVGDRELGVVRERLGWSAAECEVRDVRAGGPANLLMLEVERGGTLRELVTVFGEKSLRAETVAQRACSELEAYLAANVPVGEHLADQLLLPMAVAGGGSFRAAPLSLHATTNIDTISLFLDVPVRVEPDGSAVVVHVG